MKHGLWITAWPFVYRSPLASCFVCNKPKVKFMHSSNHTEHYRKWLHYLTLSKHDCTSDSCILNRNTLVPVTKKGRSAFPIANNYQGQCKLLRQNLYLGCESRASLFEGATLLFLRDAILLWCDALSFDEFHSLCASWSSSDTWDAPGGDLEYYCLFSFYR
jgi:hypothetical protein